MFAKGCSIRKQQRCERDLFVVQGYYDDMEIDSCMLRNNIIHKEVSVLPGSEWSATDSRCGRAHCWK